MSTMKRFLSLALALMMVISMVPTTAFATETDCVHAYDANGICTLCGGTAPAEPEATEPEATEPETTVPETTEASTEPVAQIDETDAGVIDTEAKLAGALKQNGEVKLDADIVVTETITIPQGVTVTLDLNGKTLAHSDVVNKYVLNNLGNLTIKDSVGTGTVNARGIYNGYDANDNYVSSANLIIESGTFNAKGTNGGAAVFNYGIAQIKGGSFTSVGGYSLNNRAGSTMTVAAGVTANNGMYATGATITFNGGKISGNRSGCHVVYAENSNLTINGGEFYNNNSGNATIMAAGTTTATINGGTFGIKDGRVEGNGNTWTSCLTDTANTAKMTVTDGTFNGGFRVQAGTTMIIEGGSYNDIYGSKYNIYGTVTVKGGTFTDDTAKNFAKKYLAEDAELGEDGSVTVAPMTLDKFVAAVVAANGIYDGQGKTVKITPTSGNAKNDSAEGIPNRLQKYGNPDVYYAQYQRFSELTDVKISNVNFVFVPAAVTVTDAWNPAGATTTAENINGELQLLNSGAVELTNCTFDKVAVSPINASSVAVSGSAFSGLNAYAIKDLQATTVSIANTTFDNCNGGFWFMAAPNTVTATGNTFTNVGRRGAIQFSAAGDYTNTTMNITGNTVTGGALLWQLNKTVTDAQVSAILDTTKNTYGTAYVDGSIVPVKPVAEVNGIKYMDIQEAIKAAAPNGTVELLSDVTVDEWKMITEQTISTDQLITLVVDGMIINGNGHTLTVKAIESAGNGNHLFDDARNLTVKDLTIVNNSGKSGGIGLKSGLISNVTFVGGVGVFPSTGNITITGCTFKMDGDAIYFETERDNLIVDDNVFNVGEYAIILRGGAKFTNNVVTSGKVNVANSATGEISGNNFGDNRFKVYNAATATISGNTINNLVFADATVAKSTFSNNTMSADAEEALSKVLPVASVNGTGYASLEDALKALTDGATLTLLDNITVSDAWDCRYNGAKITAANVTIDGNGKTLALTGAVKDNNWDCVFRFEGDNATVKNLTIDASAATGIQRGISSKLNIAVENCTFIGNGSSAKRAIIFGEGAGAALSSVTATVTKSQFTNWSYGVSDNQSGEDAKAVTITGSTFNNANVLISASETVTFTDNTVSDGAYVRIYSSAAEPTMQATVSGNTLSKHDDTKVSNAVNYDNVQSEFVIGAPVTVTSNGVTTYFNDLQAAIDAAGEGDIVTLQKNIKLAKGVTVNNHPSFTLDGNGFSIAPADSTVALGYQAVYFFGGKEITIKNLTFKDFAQANTTAPILRLEGAEQFILENVTFENCDVARNTDTTNSVMRVYDTDFTADGLTMKNCKGGMLMDIGPSSDYFVGLIDIKNSNFESNSVLGAALIYTNLKQAKNSYLSISNTAFTDNVVGDADSDAAAGRGVIHLGSDSVIDGCTFDGNKVYGSHANNVSYGINEYSGYNHSITNNIFKNNAAYQTNAKVGPVSGAAIMTVGAATVAGNTVEASNAFYHRASADASFTAKTARSVGTYGDSYGKTTITSGTYYGELVSYNGIEGFNITGGSFSDHTSLYKFLSEEYDAEYDRTTGLFAVEAVPVAIVNNVIYTDLEEALAAAKNGSELVLQRNVTLSDTLVIPAGYNVILNLNGKTISQSKACTASYSMIENQGELTIIGNGKISFTDTSAGDPSFGWGAYTLTNTGTLVVENGTIENLSAQNTPGAVKHMYCAIQQSGGSVTIESGTISTPTYRSIRVTNGTLTINGGTFAGQVWVQPFAEGIKLNIKGGNFAPSPGDASSVFVTNDSKDVKMSVTGGTFDGKIGASDATKLAGAVSGGIFTETAKNGTNAALLATDLIFGEADANGYYGLVNDPCYISNLEELKAFRDDVNAGNTYAGKTVTLGANIDLAGEAWTPIGTKDHPFQGTFDGGEHTISNLYINDADLSYAGLFGYAKNATIENVNIKNVDIYAYSQVGAIAGNVYSGSVSNCHVSGSIKLVAQYAYAGGIASEGYVTVTDCSVIADGMGEITVVEKSNAGGITGWRGEGNRGIYNCTVKNLNITAWATVGAITGLVHYDNTIDRCTVDNVNLYKTRVDGQASIGLAAGTWSNKADDNYTITITNNTFSNITMDGVAITSHNKLVGSNYSYYDKEIKLTENGNTETNVTADVMVVVNKEADLEKALAYCKDGETIYVGSDFAVSKALTNNKKLTLDLNGHTITGTDTTTSNFGLINNTGDLTVEDSVGGGKITLIATTDSGTNRYSAVISNNPGGKLTVNGGTLEHLGGTYMAYGIDSLTNGSMGDVSVTINGGTVKSKYRGIRQFLNSDSKQNVLTINGGTVEGVNKSVFFHDPSAKANNGTLTVSENATLNGDVYLFVTAGSTEWPVTVSIAADAVNGEVTSKNVPGQYVVTKNADDVFTKLAAVAKIGNVGYLTIDEALAAAKSNDTITLLQDATIETAYDVKDMVLTIDGEATLKVNDKLNVRGVTTLNITAPVDGDVNLCNGAILKDSTINGKVFVAGEVIFRGDNTVQMVYDYGTLTDYYGTEAPMKWSVEPGASLTILDKSRYGLGYGDQITITGELSDAMTARENKDNIPVSFSSHGIVAQESKGWNCNSSMTIEDAYVIIGNNNSFGNKSGNYGGTYVFDFNNVLMDSSRITIYEALSNSTFNITDSDVLTGTFMTRDKDSVFNITNTKLLSTTTSNGTDEGNYHAATMNLVGAELTYSAPLVMEAGTINMDATSVLTAPAITGSGKIVVDATGFTGDTQTVIKADLTAYTGEIQVIGAAYEISDTSVIIKTPVAEVNGTLYASVLDAMAAAIESGESEVKILANSREKMPADIEWILKANLTITAENPVVVDFYNEGTGYDIVINSSNNNTLVIDENVTITLKDRLIWIGYYGNNVDVILEGTLEGQQIWHGADTTVTSTGKLISSGEAMVLRRGATLTVDGGTIDANYFSILAGNIDAKDATIKSGPIWVDNTGKYDNEGGVSLKLDNTTWTSTGNLKLASEKTATMELYNGSTVTTVGAPVIDENSSIVADISSECTASSKSVFVAEVGGFKHTDLQDAIDAAEAGETVTVLKDIILTETLIIPAGKVITLDLNDKTISQTKEQTAAYSMIQNMGDLTIMDSATGGKISYIDSGKGGEYVSNTIQNSGKLTVLSGTIENMSSETVANNGYPQAIDNSGALIIEGGNICCDQYSAVRIWCTEDTDTSVTISGGTFTGAVDMQNVSGKANKGTLTITGGTFKPGNGNIPGSLKSLRFVNFGTDVDELVMNVTGGTFYGGIVMAGTEKNEELLKAVLTVHGGSYLDENVANYVADGYTTNYAGGWYTVKIDPVAKVGKVEYNTVADAVKAAKNGETVYILRDVTIQQPIVVDAGKAITLDLMTNTVRYESDVMGEAMITNNGDLAITGNGVIDYIYTGANDPYYSKGNYAINTTGALTIENGTVQVSAKDCAGKFSHALYAINTSGDVTVNGGNIYNPNNIAMRTVGAANVTVNGGEIEGLRAIWLQLPSNDVNVAPVVNLTVTGGTLIGTAIDGTQDGGNVLAIYSYSNGNDMKNVTIDISGGTFNGDIHLTGGKNKTNIETVIITGGTFNGGAMNGVEGEIHSWGDATKAAEAITITGGTYVTELSEKYAIDNGYEFVANTDGMYVLKELPYVAMIGEQGYLTITAAINAAADGDTIQLLPGTFDEAVNPWGADSTHAVEKSITIVGAADFGTTLTGGLVLGYDDNGCRDHTITIKGIAFENMGVVVAGQQNVVIDGNKFTNITEEYNSSTANANAISVLGKNINATVTNNIIDTAEESGIHLRDIKSATVTGNTVSNTGGNAITAVTGQNTEFGAVVIENNTLTNWGTSGEGRAMRINGAYNVSVNENVMTHTAAPEQFAKVTGYTSLDASANYWNGVSPETDGIFAVDTTDAFTAVDNLISYYTDADKTNLKYILVPVAMVNGTPYMTLQEAVTAADAGDVIELISKAPDKFVIVDKPLTIKFIGENTFPRNKVYCGVYEDPTSHEEIDLGPIAMDGGIIVQQVTVSDADAGEAWAYVDVNAAGHDGETLMPLQAALDAAEAAGGGTVKMIDDITVKAIVVIPKNVTLNLEMNNLTVKSLIGLKGGTITATSTTTSRNGGKLFVDPDNLVLAKDAYKLNPTVTFIPIWDPAQSAFIFANADIVHKDFTVDSNTITYKFTQTAGSYVNQVLLKNGASDNELKVLVRLEWTDADGNVAYQDFVYGDKHVSIVAGGDNMYTFRMTGYSAMSINISTLNITAMFLTDSGAASVGNTYYAKDVYLASEG